jgi:hypothetical protein
VGVTMPLVAAAPVAAHNRLSDRQFRCNACILRSRGSQDLEAVESGPDAPGRAEEFGLEGLQPVTVRCVAAARADSSSGFGCSCGRLRGFGFVVQLLRAR